MTASTSNATAVVAVIPATQSAVRAEDHRFSLRLSLLIIGGMSLLAWAGIVWIVSLAL